MNDDSAPLTIKRLAFLHRLLEGLATGIEDSAIPAFIEEARALGLSDGSPET